MQNGTYTGPYYILHRNAVVKIPASSVRRDHKYSYNYDMKRMQEFMDKGMTMKFGSECMLAGKRLTTNSIVVVETVCGGESFYTWCIRVSFHTGMNLTPLLTTHDVKFGLRVLWPVSPDVAQKWYKIWKDDDVESSLVEDWNPSRLPFDEGFVVGSQRVTKACISVVRLAQSVFSSSVSSFGDALCWQGEEGDEETDPFSEASATLSSLSPLPPPPRFSSDVTTTRIALRASTCMSIPEVKGSLSVSSFTARKDAGWCVLHVELQDAIFRRIADDILRSHGGIGSPSFGDWLTMRALCRHSKHVVETETRRFMKVASYAVAISTTSLSIADALVVRNLLVPKRIIPYQLFDEMSRLAKLGYGESVHEKMWTWVNLRTKKPPDKQLVRLRLRGVTSRPPPEFDPHLAQRVHLRLRGATPPAPPPPSDGLPDSIRVVLRTRETGPPPASPASATCCRCGRRRALPVGRADGVFDSLSASFLPSNWTCDDFPVQGVYTCERRGGEEALAPLRRSARLRKI